MWFRRSVDPNACSSRTSASSARTTFDDDLNRILIADGARGNRAGDARAFGLHAADGLRAERNRSLVFAVAILLAVAIRAITVRRRREFLGGFRVRAQDVIRIGYRITDENDVGGERSNCRSTGPQGPSFRGGRGLRYRERSHHWNCGRFCCHRPASAWSAR